jgi:hypothetical protein
MLTVAWKGMPSIQAAIFYLHTASFRLVTLQGLQIVHSGLHVRSSCCMLEQ